MKIVGRICLIALCFVGMPGSWGQGSPSEQGQERVLARISYHGTYMAYLNDDNHSPRICFEVYRSGHYRITRMMKNSGAGNFGGELTADQMDQVTKMVRSLDFDSTDGGLVRKGSELFVAEVANGDEVKRHLWMDPDHQRPFPDSAAKIIRWLQNFDARRASPITVPEMSTDPICPRASEKPLQPAS